jgi:hypothetical protein
MNEHHWFFIGDFLKQLPCSYPAGVKAAAGDRAFRHVAHTVLVLAFGRTAIGRAGPGLVAPIAGKGQELTGECYLVAGGIVDYHL